MNSRYIVFGLTIAPLFGTLACGKEECDPGQILIDHMCMPAPEPEPDARAPDGSAGAPGIAAGVAGAAGAAGSPAGGGSSGSGAPFGAPCADHAECTGETDYCSEPPGEPRFCTRSGCVDDPSLCPDDWTCMDLSIFAPGLPSICEPP